MKNNIMVSRIISNLHILAGKTHSDCHTVYFSTLANNIVSLKTTKIVEYTMIKKRNDRTVRYNLLLVIKKWNL